MNRAGVTRRRFMKGLAAGLGAAVGAGFHAVWATWAGLAMLRQLCRKDGVAVAHLQWDARAVATVRRHLVWLLPVVVATGALVGTLGSHGVLAWGDSLGRFGPVVSLLGVVTFSWGVLRGRHGILAVLRRDAPTAWFTRLRGS